MDAATRDASPRRITWEMWRITIVIAFGAFLSGLDASIVNIGLDTITEDLGVPLSQGHWVTTGYLLAMAVSLPAAGWLGRRFGPGRVWLWALLAFTGFSVLCALTSTLGGLVAARIAQGAAGGVLIPAGQTVIGQVVGAGRMGRVMATLGVVVTLAPALGPVVGGAILERTTWPWLFLINAPVGVIGLWLGLRHVPRGASDRSERADTLGLLLLSSGMPMLLFGLTEMGDTGRATLLGGGTALAGALALAAYVRHQRTVERPVLGLGLFRSVPYRLAVTTTALTGAGLFGTALLFPLWLQIDRGFSAAEAGALLIVLGVGTSVALGLVGAIIDRFGSGPASVLGTTATAGVGVLFVAFSGTGSPWVVILLLVGIGSATALAAVPPSVAAYTSVTPDDLPDATTQVNIANRLGGAAGAALLSIVLSRSLTGGDGFASTFVVMTVVSVLAALCAIGLRSSQRQFVGQGQPAE